MADRDFAAYEKRLKRETSGQYREMQAAAGGGCLLAMAALPFALAAALIRKGK